MGESYVFVVVCHNTALGIYPSMEAAVASVEGSSSYVRWFGRNSVCSGGEMLVLWMDEVEVAPFTICAVSVSAEPGPIFRQAV